MHSARPPRRTASAQTVTRTWIRFGQRGRLFVFSGLRQTRLASLALLWMMCHELDRRATAPSVLPCAVSTSAAPRRRRGRPSRRSPASRRVSIWVDGRYWPRRSSSPAAASSMHSGRCAVARGSPAFVRNPLALRTCGRITAQHSRSGIAAPPMTLLGHCAPAHPATGRLAPLARAAREIAIVRRWGLGIRARCRRRPIRLGPEHGTEFERAAW